jgi:NTP pyrophosphatase (non-canonical NTP hydrolase)
MNFDKLRTANVKRAIEWCKGVKLSLSFRGNEIGGEVGELQNKLKKVERHNLGIAGGTEPSVQVLVEIAQELADVVICADLIAMDIGINLGQAVKAKFNMTSVKNELGVFIEDDMMPIAWHKIFRMIEDGGDVLIIMKRLRQGTLTINEESTVWLRSPMLSGLKSARVDLVVMESGLGPEVLAHAKQSLCLSRKVAEIIEI